MQGVSCGKMCIESVVYHVYSVAYRMQEQRDCQEKKVCMFPLFSNKESTAGSNFAVENYSYKTNI